MDKPVGFTVTPLSPALGAEIGGLDLRDSLPQQTVDDIIVQSLEHIVLVFRNQEIDDEQQLRFAQRFGELGGRKIAPSALRSRVEGVQQNHPAILLVSNIKLEGEAVGAFGDDDMWYHIDSGYAERPYKYTFLHGVALPSSGGNTLFANMYAAYEALPAETRDKLAGRKALHIHQYKRSEAVDISGDFSNSPHHYHPVFVTHPETGRKSLFVDRLMTARIEGLEPDDSAATLNELFEHSEKPEFVYEHVWQLGDLVIWDNRRSIHGRTYFPENEERLLRRCTIQGEVPVE